MKNSSLWMVVGLVACFAACDDEVSTTDTGSGGSGATGGAGGATTTSEGGGQGGAGGAACTAPAAPSGAMPADMATDVDAASTTTLDWDDVPNAAGYDVYFGACPAPDYPSASYQRVTDSELTGQTLTSSTTYCWKVVSAADAGNTCVTEGDAWTFETACDDPVAGAPTLTMRAASYPACTDRKSVV